MTPDRPISHPQNSQAYGDSRFLASLADPSSIGPVGGRGGRSAAFSAPLADPLADPSNIGPVGGRGGRSAVHFLSQLAGSPFAEGPPISHPQNSQAYGDSRFLASLADPSNIGPVGGRGSRSAVPFRSRFRPHRRERGPPFPAASASVYENDSRDATNPRNLFKTPLRIDPRSTDFAPAKFASLW